MFDNVDTHSTFVSLSNTPSVSSGAGYLSWRCIDSFEKANSKKMFYVGGVNFSETQKRALESIFSEMKEKWGKEIANAFADRKKYFRIGAGNYTFFFLLPNAINLVKQKEPFLSVKLELVEARDTSDVSNDDIDLILGGGYPERSQFNLYLKELRKAGYIVSRPSYYEEVFLAAAKELVEENNGEENVMKFSPILFGRLAGRHEYLYSTAPASRKNIEARIVSDLYFYAYLLMQHAVGIWHIYSSCLKKDKKMRVLQSTPVTAIIRCFFYPNRSVKLCRFISRRLIGMLRTGLEA